jgi:diguanylate cyclase
MLYTTTDVIYALQVATATSAAGSPLNAAWAIGLSLNALYVDGAERRKESARQEASPATGATALVVSTAATAAGLGVLVVSSRARLSTLAVVLAAVTLLAAAARTLMAFRQLVRMADLRRQATTDYLTGLPNRRALYIQAGIRMAGPEPRRQALLMLDLDRFKEVNDSLGHHTGDQLLIQVGARLSEHLRGGDLLVRLGGDEFAVLLEDADHDQAAAVAVKLCAVLAEPFPLQDIAVYSAVSIGIAVFPDDGLDLNTLLRKADIAMYQAKASSAAITSTAVPTTPTSPPGCRRWRSFGPHWPATSSSSTTSPRSTWPPGRSTTWRRWCAGTTPPAACSTPTGSWTWSKKRA